MAGKATTEPTVAGFRPLAGITVFRTAGLVTINQAADLFPSPGGDYGLSDRILCHHHMYGFLIRFQHTRRLYVGVAREAFKYIPKSCHPGVLCHVRHRLTSIRYHCILLGPFVKSQTPLPHALFPSAHVRSPLMRHSMEPS